MADGFMDAIYKGAAARAALDRSDAYRSEVDRRIQQTDDKDQARLVREQADWIARTGDVILRAPPDQRPNLYGMALEDAKARGYDTSRLPPQYDTAVEGYIRFNVERARAFTQPTRRGRGGAPSAGGAGGGLTFDPPYQPQGATPPGAADMPLPASQPAPASAPPAGVVPTGPVSPRQPIGAPARPGMAPAPVPGDITSTGFGQPPAPVGPAPGASPYQQQGGPAPSVTLKMPPSQPALAQAAPSPVAPVRDDSGQDVVPPPATAVIPPTPGIALEPGDRIVRGRGGAVRTVGGMVEVRDKDGKPQFRPMVKPQTAPRNAPVPLEDITDADGRVIGQRDPRNGKITTIDRDAMKGGRAMTETARKGMRELAATADAMDASLGTFKDNFGGYGSAMLGNADLGFKARVSGDTSGADWWRVYQSQKNIIRNDLFGAALTATEKAEFEKADINPGLRADVIRKNLQIRARLTMTAVERTGRSMLADGINPKAVEEIVGPTVWAKIKGGPAPAGGQAPAAPGGTDLRKKYGLE